MDELKEENKRLFDALRSIAGHDDFDLDKHGDIAKILSELFLVPPVFDDSGSLTPVTVLVARTV